MPRLRKPYPKFASFLRSEWVFVNRLDDDERPPIERSGFVNHTRRRSQAIPGESLTRRPHPEAVPTYHGN